MKTHLLKIILFLAVFTGGTYFAFGMSTGMITQESPFNATLFITILTPAAVWLANLVITKVAPLIPTWAIFGLVPLFGAATDWLNNLISGDSPGMVISILASLGAVFINELLKNWGARKKLSDLRQEAILKKAQ